MHSLIYVRWSSGAAKTVKAIKLASIFTCGFFFCLTKEQMFIIMIRYKQIQDVVFEEGVIA